MGPQPERMADFFDLRAIGLSLPRKRRSIFPIIESGTNILNHLSRGAGISTSRFRLTYRSICCPRQGSQA